MKASLISTIGCWLVVACSNGDGSTKPVTEDGDPGTGVDASAPGDGEDTSTGDGADGATGGGDDGGPASEDTALVPGCPGQMLRAGIPEALADRGPWPVGARTTTLGGVTTELWYPARQGSEAGLERASYDIREQLPDEDRAKIPDEHNPRQPCACYRELPLDEAAGPYPVIQFIHGTAGFRTTNLDNAAHWASRGFVVVSSDHPGIRLKDMLGGNLTAPRDQAGDARKVLTELFATGGEVAFLAGHLDATRVGLIGHSAGGQAVSSLNDLADVSVVYAAASTVTKSRVDSMLQLVGAADSVAGSGQGGYDGSTTARRRFLSIAKGGHLVGGNLCTLRDPTDPSLDIVDLAETYKLGSALIQLIGVRQAFGTLFNGCNELADDTDPFIAASRGIEIMNHVTSGVFEERLHCVETASRLEATAQTFGSDVAGYEQSLP